MVVAFIDLDGTLLRPDGTVSPYSRKILERAQAAGVEVVFATARPPRATFAVLPRVFHRHRLICYNGGWVLHDGRPVHRREIPAHAVASVLHWVRTQAPGAAFGFERDDRLLVRGSFDRHFPAVFTEFMRPDEPFADSPKVLVDVTDGFPWADFHAALPADCEVVRTDRGGLAQIMARGVTKASGAEFVLGCLGATFADAIAFGDDTNDLPLLQRVGCPVAPANAVPAVRAAARHIAAPNAEDGVARFLEQWLESRAPAGPARPGTRTAGPAKT